MKTAKYTGPVKPSGTGAKNIKNTSAAISVTTFQNVAKKQATKTPLNLNKPSLLDFPHNTGLIQQPPRRHRRLLQPAIVIFF